MAVRSRQVELSHATSLRASPCSETIRASVADDDLAVSAANLIRQACAAVDGIDASAM
jgi:hypothetical protein